MHQLRVRLLGNVAIHRGSMSVRSFPTRRSEGLFAYLVASRDRLLHRETLCGEFWGDYPDAHARKALRTELWRVRSVIEADPGDRGVFLRVENDHLGFVVSPAVWVDVWELDECRRLGDANGALLDPPAAQRLAASVELYRGDFLEGYYDDWCSFERERFRTVFLTILERLLEHHRVQGDWIAAIRWGQEILRHDSLREHVHRVLMVCHHFMGDRPLALRQYRECVRVLREELDIEPMEETKRLYESIRCGEPVSRAEEDRQPVEAQVEGRVRRAAADVNRALDHLYFLVARLERTRNELRWGQEGRVRLPPVIERKPL